jgi:hypothetical protein
VVVVVECVVDAELFDEFDLLHIYDFCHEGGIPWAGAPAARGSPACEGVGFVIDEGDGAEFGGGLLDEAETSYGVIDDLGGVGPFAEPVFAAFFVDADEVERGAGGVAEVVIDGVHEEHSVGRGVGEGVTGASHSDVGGDGFEAGDAGVVIAEVGFEVGGPAGEVGFVPCFEVPGFDLFPAVAFDEVGSEHGDELLEGVHSFRVGLLEVGEVAAGAAHYLEEGLEVVADELVEGEVELGEVGGGVAGFPAGGIDEIEEAVGADIEEVFVGDGAVKNKLLLHVFIQEVAGGGEAGGFPEVVEGAGFDVGADGVFGGVRNGNQGKRYGRRQDSEQEGADVENFVLVHLFSPSGAEYDNKTDSFGGALYLASGSKSRANELRGMAGQSRPFAVTGGEFNSRQPFEYPDELERYFQRQGDILRAKKWLRRKCRISDDDAILKGLEK